MSRETFVDFWRDMVAANSALADREQKMRISSLELERLMRRAYERGRNSVPAPSVFESLFGK